MKTRYLFLVASVILLAGCGGGGMTTQNPMTPPANETQTRSPAEIRTEAIRQALAALPKHQTNTATEVAGYLRDMTDATALVSDGQGGTENRDAVFTGLVTFPDPPLVRFNDEASAIFRVSMAKAVYEVNAWLPPEKHIRVDTFGLGYGDVQLSEYSLAFTEDDLAHIPTGQIWAIESDDPRFVVDNHNLAYALADPVYEYDSTQERYEAKRMRAGLIWGPVSQDERYEYVEQRTQIMIHELLHAMGFYDHVDPGRYPGTNMGPYAVDPDADDPEAYVKSVDGTALLAAYTLLEPGTEPEELSTSALGAWSTEVPYFGHDFGDYWYETNLINGYAVPRFGFDGYPDTWLADSALAGLGGTATWRGGFAGFTPDHAPVEGNSAIQVDFDADPGLYANLTGTASFTNLSYVHDGSAWGNGNLGWGLDILGNYFLGSDNQGYVYGEFAGSRHEYALGFVERDDLTGAFGGERE